MNQREPCSHINNKSVLFGLSYSDISVLGAVLAVILFINKHFIGAINISYWGLLSVLSMGLLLIPIRIKYRRKIIRDSAKNLVKRRLLNGPKHH